MTIKDAVLQVLRKSTEVVVHYVPVRERVQELREVGGATPDNTVNRELNSLCRQGLVKSPKNYSGYYYLKSRDGELGQTQMPLT